MEGVLSSTDKQSMVSSFLEIAVGQTADTAKQFLQVMIFFLKFFFISDFFDNKVCIFGTKRLNLLLGFHYYYYYYYYYYFWVLILVCVLNFGAV